jgi:Icc-related predicted phosphoesterase
MKIKRISDAIARTFRMRICHVSDTHGGFPRLHGKYDCVVHSGDLFPNSHHVGNGEKAAEARYQLQWLKDNISTFKQWLNGHPFIYVPGNHDFMHPDMMATILQQEGIQAHSITDRVFTLQGVNFYGFPYVPAIGGNYWNFEREIPEMQVEVDRMVEDLNKSFVDVLVCHAPLHQCLDLSYGNEILGSTVIANALDYKLTPGMQPTNYLCGHIHESHGLTLRNGMLVSNAATTYQIIQV